MLERWLECIVLNYYILVVLWLVEFFCCMLSRQAGCFVEWCRIKGRAGWGVGGGNWRGGHPTGPGATLCVARMQRLPTSDQLMHIMCACPLSLSSTAARVAGLATSVSEGEVSLQHTVMGRCSSAIGACAAITFSRAALRQQARLLF